MCLSQDLSLIVVLVSACVFMHGFCVCLYPVVVCYEAPSNSPGEEQISD